MKGKFLIYYNWHWNEDTPCSACIILPYDRTLFIEGKTFNEAKEKLIEKIKLLPEDESVEIC